MIKDNVLAIDIGGSKIIAAVVDGGGNIVALSKILLPQKNCADLKKYILTAIKKRR